MTEMDIYYRQSLGWIHQRQNCLLAIRNCLLGKVQKESDAANVGTYFHKRIEEFLKGNEDGREIPWPIRLYIMAKNISPENCERLLSVSLPEFEGRGTIDAITDEGVILDWKFPQKKWQKQKFQDYCDIQAYFYIWLARQAGLNVTGYSYVVAWTDETRGADFEYNQVTEWIVPMDEALINMAWRKARTRYLEYLACKDNGSWPANPSSFNCKYCNYRDTCDEAAI